MPNPDLFALQLEAIAVASRLRRLGEHGRSGGVVGAQPGSGRAASYTPRFMPVDGQKGPGWHSGAFSYGFRDLRALDASWHEWTVLAVPGRCRRVIGKNGMRFFALPRYPVFSRPDLVPFHPNEVTRAFQAAARELGLPAIGPHGLRHSVATELGEQGVPLTVVSRLLGHSSTRVTGDVYSHVFDETAGAAVSQVAKALDG